MKCDRCGKEATVTVRAIFNNYSEDFHLCSDCAKEVEKMAKDMTDKREGFDFRKLAQIFMPSLDQIIDGYYDYKKNQALDFSKDTDDRVCPNCERSISDIKMGEFSCPSCYDLDSQLTRGLLKSYNNFGKYQGPYPRKQRNFRDLAQKIRELQEELVFSVETEDFEKAANLRDEIEELNTRVKD